MKRQNDMRKQRVTSSFLVSNKNHFGKKFLKLERDGHCHGKPYYMVLKSINDE